MDCFFYDTVCHFFLAAACDAKQAKLLRHGDDKMPSNKTGCSGNHDSR